MQQIGTMLVGVTQRTGTQPCIPSLAMLKAQAASLQASVDDLQFRARSLERMSFTASAVALRERAVKLEARLFVIAGQIAEGSL